MIQMWRKTKHQQQQQQQKAPKKVANANKVLNIDGRMADYIFYCRKIMRFASSETRRKQSIKCVCFNLAITRLKCTVWQIEWVKQLRVVHMVHTHHYASLWWVYNLDMMTIEECQRARLCNLDPNWKFCQSRSIDHFRHTNAGFIWVHNANFHMLSNVHICNSVCAHHRMAVVGNCQHKHTHTQTD